MRYRGIVSLSVALLLAAGCGGLEWETYHSDEGRFSIRMPDDPDPESYDAATPSGSMPVHTASTEQDSVLYLVTYIDLPEPLADTSAQDLFLEQSKGWGTEGVQGNVLHDSAVALGSHAGREILLRKPDGSLYRVRLYAAGERLYQIVMTGPPDKVSGREADRFFDSFSIEEGA